MEVGFWEKKRVVFNRDLLGIFRIGTLNWTIKILVGIYWGFGDCGFWRVKKRGFWGMGMDGFTVIGWRGGD